MGATNAIARIVGRERPSAEGKQGVLAPKVMGERATRGHVTSGNVLSVALAPTNCTANISDHGIKTLEPSGFLSEEISIIYYEDGTPPSYPFVGLFCGSHGWESKSSAVARSSGLQHSILEIKSTNWGISPSSSNSLAMDTRSFFVISSGMLNCPISNQLAASN